MAQRALRFATLAVFAASAALAAPPAPVHGSSRFTLSLDGVWQIADSVEPDTLPGRFTHTVPVPGLANSADPAFADVDRFDSRELINVEIEERRRPASARTTAVGVSHQARNYFWYKRAFMVRGNVDAPHQIARLRINKAQFGTKVWLNGQLVGEHNGCFTSAVFDVSKLLDWKKENVLLVRIGAHPAVLPTWVPTGTDQEKLKWTPGIYDSVTVELSDNPVIESVQVAPSIADSTVKVQTVVRNYSSVGTRFTVHHNIHAWGGDVPEARAEQPGVELAPGESKTVTSVLHLPNARLWTPETPNLYVLETSSGGDSETTRFGMRELKFDPATRRAMLNGKVYFLRGSNIALHRFFEDPECKTRPWDKEWVRKLLVDTPKRMNWNAFRLTLGPPPQFWFDIADEAGILLQSEFPIWKGHWDEWRDEELVAEFGAWMRDSWNHPSLVVWDASNETHGEWLRDNVIAKVRGLDLSNRPWDNGYTLPMDAGDMVEDHPYLFIKWWQPPYAGFQMTELERMTGAKTDWNAPHPTAQATVINEYGWLWLHRDGTPTSLTERVYEKLLGATATPAQRRETQAYLLAGLTEFWRAHRQAAGVEHFVYLTCDYPGTKTSDNFADIARLEFEPHFADYVREAFKPLGVYVNFWQPTLKADTSRVYDVMMINDAPTPVDGKLTLSFERADGAPFQPLRYETNFALPALGQHTYSIQLRAPAAPGAYILKATAKPAGEATVSRRKVDVR